jgi:hypothetical protein
MALLWDDEVQHMWNDNVVAANSEVFAGDENLDCTIFQCVKIDHNCEGLIITRAGKKLKCLCGCHHIRTTDQSTRIWDFEE